MTLKDLLQDCDGLREERVKVCMESYVLNRAYSCYSQVYLAQICKGLCAIHDASLVHRGEHIPHVYGMYEF